MHWCFNCEEVPKVVRGNLWGYSINLSHFFLYRPRRILFDCGEGVGMRLDDRVFVPEVLAVSHGHFDHVAGLADFLMTRSGIPGSQLKPLLVLYPKSEKLQRWLSHVVSAVGPERTSSATWRRACDGNEPPLRGGAVLEARVVPHLEGEVALAYKIKHERYELRPEYESLGKKEVDRLLARDGTEAVTRQVWQTEFVYSGDTTGVDPEWCRNSALFVHDAALLDQGDRDNGPGSHPTTIEALRIAQQARARNVVSFHVNRRYRRDDIRRVVRTAIAELGLEVPVVVVRGAYGLPTVEAGSMITSGFGGGLVEERTEAMKHRAIDHVSVGVGPRNIDCAVLRALGVSAVSEVSRR
jgi:ribonuclease Z